MKTYYVEFGGDPSNDKELYKRYSSTEPFKPLFPDCEVIELVRKSDVEHLMSKPTSEEKLRKLSDLFWQKLQNTRYPLNESQFFNTVFNPIIADYEAAKARP